MAVTVPDHDTLIQHIQNYVIQAVDKHGWPDVRDLCENYDVSPTMLRRIYLWEPTDHTSFNFRKLIEAYDFAYDAIHDLRVKKPGS